MLTPYEAFPTLAGMPINERVEAFKETCLRGIKSGQLTQADLLQATEEALQMQAYELAQGIELARQTFISNPQLSFLQTTLPWLAKKLTPKKSA